MTGKKLTVAIIGSGMMGSALAFPLCENGHKVNLCGTHLDREIIGQAKKTNRHMKFDRDFPGGVSYFYYEEMLSALSGADFVICGVSSFGVDWFGENVLPQIPQNVPILSVTKGLICLEDGSLISYPQYWLQKYSPSANISAIGGPCTSYELVSRDCTHVTFCGKDSTALRMFKAAMETDYYNISLSSDVFGTEAAVALKNGYALAVALTIGINNKKFGEEKLHFNSQAGVFGQAAKEMHKLLKLFGAGENSLYTGIGDLYVTVYGGRTRQLGILLGEGFTFTEATEKLKGVTLESVVVSIRVARALKILSEKGKADLCDFPLLLCVDKILTESAPAAIPWKEFEREE